MCYDEAKEVDTMVFQQKEPIQKGWSGDKKYRITDREGTSFLLRISPMEQMEKKRRQFACIQRVAQLGIPMCLPVEFGQCDEGAYMVLSWVI